ncbi:hypothetical protein ABT168_04375 [Streptomyces sp. NPDC001793]
MVALLYSFGTLLLVVSAPRLREQATSEPPASARRQRIRRE